MGLPQRPREPGRLTPVMFDFPNPFPKSVSLPQRPRESGRLSPVMFDFPNPFPKSVSLPQRPRESGRLTPVIFDDTPAYDAPTRSASTTAFDAPYAPLGYISSNILRGDQMIFDAQKEASQSTAQSGTMADAVEVPYFVLGIAKGAGEAE
jgi:hypothetical protein